MKVFKFGGASVRDANSVKNVAKIMRKHEGEAVFVVISAMGKTTNGLERVVNAYFRKEGNAFEELEKVKKFHHDIVNKLFPAKHAIFDEVNNTLVEIEWVIEDEPTGTFDFEYDQIVSVGEILSTKIISTYLNENGIKNQWIDCRDFIKTNNTYREAKVDWELSEQCIKQLKLSEKVLITQGFSGCTSENYTTTLGREGSDFTASIVAYLLDAESVTIWKDVPGVLNADPKWFDECEKLHHISYLEAAELAYYGASVIHPKTIKPLQNKHIPLYVRSFVSLEEEGTVINEETTSDSLIPSFIFRMNQVLISISPRDYSFIMEENLSDIFACFHKHRVKINLMQNSAISFSVCVDNEPDKIPGLINDLHQNDLVRYNENMELVTIRHYDQATIDRVTVDKEILLEQKTRHTARMVMKDKSV
ncbi:MAG: aspartate kinase [Flavobacteriales bacterium]|nr:MAG: aspartate kinase [Flavobacteriales bacterium]